MSWVTYFAIYFIVWWITLFAVLPFGLKTQDENEEVTLGTVSSAPRGPHVLRAMLWTTLVSMLICASAYGLATWLDLGLDDLPHFLPEPK
jgi:predicted secreted protein